MEAATNSFLRAAELALTDEVMLPTICRKLIAAGGADAALHFLSTIGVPGPSVLTVMAMAQSAKGDFGGASLTLGKAADLEPGNAATWRALAVANGRYGNYQAAIAAYKTYMERKLPDAEDYLAYADLLLLAKQEKAAQQALDQAMAAGAEHADTHLLAAKLARLDGDYNATRRHLKQAIAKRPAGGDAWQLLLETEEQKSLPQFAAECVRLAADEKSGTRNRILLSFTAGRAFEKLDLYRKAFEQFSAANNLQKADQASRSLTYDSAETERLATREQAEFDAPFAGASLNDPEQQPIFILGMPRSGTTLVERILGGLEGVHSGGELEALQFIANQYYWDLAKDRVARPRDLTSADWDSLARDYWRRVMREPCRLSDKMPHNYWHIGFICAMFPKAPIVYMRRDPRDICMSIYSRVFADSHLYATGLQSLAHHVTVSMHLMDHWKTLYPKRILEFSYEDLVTDPVRQTKLLARHCGLEWRPGCLEFHKRVEASHTPSEMQVREPLNTKGIASWRRYEDELKPLLDAFEQYGTDVSELR
jgi:tetratricopeptide (TPR) repeat protein